MMQSWQVNYKSMSRAQLEVELRRLREGRHDDEREAFICAELALGTGGAHR